MSPKNNLAYRQKEQIKPDTDKKRQLELCFVPLCERYQREEKWAVCGTNGVPPKERYYEDVERLLISQGKADPNATCIILSADKASLSNINRTGGTGAGNAVVENSLQVLGATMSQAYPSSSQYMIRRNPVSDETDQIVTGNYEHLAQLTPLAFLEIHKEMCRKSIQNLDEIVYMDRRLIRQGSKWVAHEVPQTLGKYSRALKDPSLVTASHLGLSQLLRLCEQSQGFISRTISAIEKEEQKYIDLLPQSFRPTFASSIEPSPFIGEPVANGFLPDNSIAIEIKFSHTNNEDRFAPLMHISETKKGRAGILSDRFGLSYINTYMGKETADHILSAVAQAMKEFEKSSRYEVNRTSSNLIYVVLDSKNPMMVASTINSLIKKQLETVLGKQANALPFIPKAIAINGSKLHSNDLRAALALNGMGLEHLSTEVLTYTDLLVSAVNAFREEAIRESLSRLNPVAREIGQNVMNLIHNASSAFEGIRDTEDLVWTLRHDMKSAKLGQGQQNKENSVWRFAVEYGKQFRNAIIDTISGL